MNSDLNFYFALLKKRLPVMLVILVLSVCVGLGLAVTLPPKFSADARLLVENAQIPGSMVETTVQTSADKQLQIIEERLMTRANMIDVANKYSVFDNRDELDPNDVFTAMREMTEITVVSGNTQRATIMTISFESHDPNTAADVVNEFVTLVESESATIRQEEAGETAEFFESEVERLGNELTLRSARIVEFKEANKDALPEELDYRLERQTQLQERLNLTARDRASLNEQRNRLAAVGTASGVQAPTMTPQQQEIARVQGELNSALSVYSESNPRVRMLRAQLDALRASMNAGNEGGQGGSSGDPMQDLLDIQIAEIDSRIEFLDADILRGEAELERLREAIEKTPENAIRLEALERDYENTQRQYNEAVSSLGRAKVGESIEAQGRGERVTVIERAIPPTTASSPNRKLVAAGGFLMGGALAGLFFVLTELLNRTIRRPVDLVRGLGVQPLATIPYIERETVRRRRQALGTVALVALLAAIPITLWLIHQFYLPLDLIVDRGMEILGL